MKTGAVIVTYHSDKQDVIKSISHLAAEVDEVCVVDNSDDDVLGLALASISNHTYLPQYMNRGIAAAQNAGISHFLSQGYDFILFSDQDTLIPKGTVGRLHGIFKALEVAHYTPGAVCPRAYNAATGQPYPHQVNSLGEVAVKGHRLTEVTYAMSSISLIPSRLFTEAGMMAETLFIDGVDSEWCWRARQKQGVRFFVAEDLHVAHHLGIGNGVIAGKSISITPPYRMYYQYRNYLWLFRLSYVPWKWKCYNGFKYLAKIFYYGLFGTPRKDYLREIFKGIYSGMKKNRDL